MSKQHYIRIFKLRFELVTMPSCIRLVNLINENIMKIDSQLSELIMQFESVLTSENYASSTKPFQKGTVSKWKNKTIFAV